MSTHLLAEKSNLSISYLQSMIQAVLLAGLVSLIVTPWLLGANYLSANLPRTVIHDRIAKAFSSGALGDAVHLRTNTKQGAHQYNDCLILAMAFDDRPAAKLRALSPVTPAELPGNNPCVYLQTISAGGEPTPLGPGTFYHRYLHGQVALTALALQWMDLSTLRVLNDALAFGMLLVLISTNLIFLVSALDRISIRPSQPSEFERAYRHGSLLVLACTMMLFYGVQFYGMSLGHAPSDAVDYLYLFAATFVSFTTVRPWLALTIHAVFGVLTAYFELFTGGLPLGVSLIFFCYASLAVGTRRNEVLWLALLSSVAFLTAFVVAVVTKLVVAGTFFGYHEVFGNFLSQLHFWTDGERVGVVDTAIALAESSHYLGAGWRLLGVLLLALSASAFAFSLFTSWKRFQPGDNWQYAALLTLSFASIVLWYLVFRKHAYQHNFFMIRISVMLIASSFLLLLFTARDRLAGLLRSAAVLARSLPEVDTAAEVKPPNGNSQLRST